MKRSVRGAALGVVFTACLSGTLYAYPELPEDLGLDFWNDAPVSKSIQEVSKFDDVMDRQQRATQRRIEMKDALIEDLFTDRRSLSEVVGEFMFLLDQAPKQRTIVLETTLGATDQEKYVRNVLKYAAARLNTLPGEKSSSIKERLVGEARKILGDPNFEFPM